MTTQKSYMENPLLEDNKLPPFRQIQPDHVEPAIDALLEQCRRTVKEILSKDQKNSWETLCQAIEDSDDRLNRAWSPVSHLHSVADNDALRVAYNKCLPKITAYSTEMGQNEDLYQAYLQLANSDAFDRLNEAQQKIINNDLREFRLSGIGLDKSKQALYKQLKLDLSRLQTQFEENVLDATHAWEKHITDIDELAGLPETAMGLARQQASDKGLDGWLLTLDFPSYFPVMTYADKPDLREELYRAYTTRASDQWIDGVKWDNSEVMVKILALRKQMATMLGYGCFAEYSLERKMANTPAEVIDFLLDLADKSVPVARQDLLVLNHYVKENHGIDELNAWDISYYSEKLRQQTFDFSQEALRPYFPVPNVLTGMFLVVKHLYGLDIKVREGVETWHEDVSFFDINDENGDLRGSFYLDLYARKNKRGGAWMDECVVRKKTEQGIQKPVAYLTCNFTPPVADEPSLLTHDEVITLFHEFGHGLHHMLTQIEYSGVSGINGVPWDAVELPSQFMENWCWERECLDLFARHVRDDTPLPDSLYEKMIAARNFQSGMQMVRQLEFSLFDIHLHVDEDMHSSQAIQDLLDKIRDKVAVLMPPDFNRFQHSFGHIFAGGYAAGYYSYKWAEVLSADAFSRFEENGIFDRKTGLAFLHTILEKGGSRDPLDLFVDFRGRKPDIKALLRHSGIKA